MIPNSCFGIFSVLFELVAAHIGNGGQQLVKRFIILHRKGCWFLVGAGFLINSNGRLFFREIQDDFMLFFCEHKRKKHFAIFIFT